MKKFILTTSIVSLSLLSQAQISLFNNEVDQEWREVYSYVYVDENRLQEVCDKETIITKGNTIEKNAVSYFPILKTENGVTVELGYFREDGEKYYFTPTGSEEEFMLYDFGLQKGETVKIYDEFYWRQKKDNEEYIHNVTDVETITDSKGIQRKKITLDNNEVWIEGIGSMFGLLHSGRIVVGSMVQLTSYKEDGALVFENICNCTWNETSVENTSKNFVVWYNSIYQKLVLTLPTDNNEIKIFDLQGKLLLQQNVGFSAEIHVSMLQVGTYVLVVNGESYKFVKE